MDVAPENTVPAVERAIEAGADGVEIDVRRCADAIVVIHDETVDRVTEASGPVADFTAAELEQLPVNGGATGVPTFEAVCEVVPPDRRLVVELKEDDIVDEVTSTLAAHDFSAVLSSFVADALTSVTAFPTAYLFDEDPTTSLETALDLDCTEVHPAESLCTPSFVEDVRTAGFDTVAWPVNTRTVWESCRDMGVDGFITDHPDWCGADDGDTRAF